MTIGRAAWVSLMLIAGIGAARAGSARASEMDPVTRSLVEAERAFARASAEKGIREAFLAYLAEWSIVFRPGPVDGRTWYRARAEIPGRLTWEPAFAEVSGAGDMGYTTGPWELRGGTSAADSVAERGHYVSVWMRRPDGTWCVAVDVGIIHAQADSAQADSTPVAFELAPRDTTRAGAAAGRQAEAKALVAADRALARAVRSDGASAALAAHATDDVRVYRMRALPVTGRGAIRGAVAAAESLVAWQPVGGAPAQSGDLAYTYGTGEGSPPAGPMSYLRIWRKDVAGEWRVALDLAIPAPR